MCPPMAFFMTPQTRFALRCRDWCKSRPGQWPGLEGMRRERAEDLADSEIHGQSREFQAGQCCKGVGWPASEAL